jgi:hypothetical protein
MAVPTLTPAFIIPEGIGGGLSGGGGNVGATAAGVVAAGVIAGGLAVVAAPVVAGLAAKASLLTAASPLGLLAVGAFLKGLEQLREWGWFNYRPAPTTQNAPSGTDIILFPGGAQNFRIRYTRSQSISVTKNCSSGQVFSGAPQDLGSEEVITPFRVGVGVSMQTGAATFTQVCESGPNTNATSYPVTTIIKADGSREGVDSWSTGAISRGSGAAAVTTTTFSNVRLDAAGGIVPLVQTVQNAFAPGTRPRLDPPTLPDAPILPAPAVPLESPVLPPPPDRRPLAPPVVTPRPGQQPARVPVPGPSPGPSPGPGPPPVPAQPAPLQVPGIGPLPLPAPLPVPVTPVEVVVVDGLPISGPGQAPAPNLVAIAQELGRLERKNEILMRRPENGGLGEAAENSLLNGLRELLEGLVGELLNDVGGGSFQLIRPCQAPGGGDPLPPVVVPYSGGTNATMAVLAKLDGIAGLIQAHKDVGQPTCVTPIFGEEVTVHFESE